MCQSVLDVARRAASVCRMDGGVSGASAGTELETGRFETCAK